MDRVAAQLEHCLLLQHPYAKEDQSRIWEKADVWNRHSPNTEMLKLHNGAKLFVGGLEEATAAAFHNFDAVGAVGDTRSPERASQVVRHQNAPTVTDYAYAQVAHCFVDINRHMRKPLYGQRWTIKELAKLMATILTLMGWLAAGKSLQLHCISPLFPVHRFSLLRLSFRLPDCPALPKSQGVGLSGSKGKTCAWSGPCTHILLLRRFPLRPIETQRVGGGAGMWM